MSGIEVDVRPADEDGRVTASNERMTFVPIVSVDGVPAFLRIEYNGVPAYFCASAAIVDIDAPVGSNFYDVKAHFLAAVPLVMFVTSDISRRDVAAAGAGRVPDHRRSAAQEPIRVLRFSPPSRFDAATRFHDQRCVHSVELAPHVTRARSEFFRREADVFSVSIHGCDHVAAEFGSASPETLDNKARLAQTRMRAHQQRTGIEHDPVMVFPQGVFSHECPPVLKRNGFVAAVNTEIAPVNNGHARTTVRDVWDTAILAYGTFPIYTRRYASHGIENFAFDLLLGKPCFIVAHHEFFRDGGAALVTPGREIVQSQLHAALALTSRGHSRRVSPPHDGNVDHVEMYGCELRLYERYRPRAGDLRAQARERSIARRARRDRRVPESSPRSQQTKLPSTTDWRPGARRWSACSTARALSIHAARLP